MFLALSKDMKMRQKTFDCFEKKEINTFRTDIFQRCQYLRAALIVASTVDGTNSTLNWEKCISTSIESMRQAGFVRLKSGTAQVAKWYIQFRDKSSYSSPRKFPNLLQLRKQGPRLFLHYPGLKISLSKFINSNLQQISAEIVLERLLTQIIPRYIEDNDFFYCLSAENNDVERTTQFEELALYAIRTLFSSDDDGNDNDSFIDDQVQMFLASCGMTTLSESTCRAMMYDLGCTYDDHKKSFSNNTHEKHIAARIHYVFQYLDEERRAPHYIQIRKCEANKLKNDGKLNNDFNGQPFQKDGEDWLEFHVDLCKEFFDLWLARPLDERYSINMTPDDVKVMFHGQDEAVVSQFDSGKKAWRGTSGEQALLQKSKGKGIMLSGIVSRVLGWDPVVSHEDLAEINRNREGEKYIDEEAALEVQSTTRKPPLITENLPWLKFVEFGSNSEGWWTGANMHLLVEDFADCIKVLHPHIHHILFVDWSQGHARKRPDGLNAANMNKGFGGAQPIFHYSFLSVACFGDFVNPGMLSQSRDLNVLVKQSFAFTEGDEGPCWMSQQEREATKYDWHILGETQKEFLSVECLRLRRRIYLNEGFDAQKAGCRHRHSSQE